MSEQRIDTGADAAVSTDADPGEGLGTAGPSGDPRGAAGGDAEMPQPTPDRQGGGAGAGPDDTEGASYLRDTQANQGGEADLGGRAGGGAGSGGGSGSSGGSGGGGASGSAGGSAGGSTPGDASRGGAPTGEVGAEPSERRREVDPGSVAEEFGDRADTAPEDDIAHPSI